MARRLDVTVECVINARNTTGESPLWSAREAALLGRYSGWADLSLASGEAARAVTWQLPAAVGSIGLACARRNDRRDAERIPLVRPRDRARALLAHPEPEVPTNRFNDGKVSPEGRFWAGTMDERPEKEAIGSLYRLDRIIAVRGWPAA